uniref:Uncharacterized protein n=1 Tax=Lates calcarifer TaxID=8187 RepID=A0A4W6C8H3_LATCA
ILHSLNLPGATFASAQNTSNSRFKLLCQMTRQEMSGNDTLHQWNNCSVICILCNNQSHLH